MAYLSRYKITAEDRRPSVEQVMDELLDECTEAPICHEDAVKWYNWKEDMESISRFNPGILFKVIRTGEDSGDLEVGYFLDGRYQGGKAEMRLPEVDEEKWGNP